jgi:perosamine synthetase
MHERELLTHEFMRPGMARGDLDQVLAAFEKVWTHRDELRTVTG